MLVTKKSQTFRQRIRVRFLVICSGAVVLAACSKPDASIVPHYDVLITGGIVYDGGLQPGRRTIIGISGDRIVSMNAPAQSTADRIIDASDRLVVPGFIDPHTHAGVDLIDVKRNTNANYLTQGVTTVFIGNDGDGVADLNETLQLFSQQGTGTNVAFSPVMAIFASRRWGWRIARRRKTNSGKCWH